MKTEALWEGFVQHSNKSLQLTSEEGGGKGEGAGEQKKPFHDKLVLRYCRHHPYLPLEGADVMYLSQRGHDCTKTASLLLCGTMACCPEAPAVRGAS